MDCSISSSDTCVDPCCVSCRYPNSLLATYAELPGWVFVLSEAGEGDFAVGVYDAKGTPRLFARGQDLDGMIAQLRAQVLGILGKPALPDARVEYVI